MPLDGTAICTTFFLLVILYQLILSLQISFVDLFDQLNEFILIITLLIDSENNNESRIVESPHTISPCSH